jgi:subtilisin family serine protease
VLVRPAHRGFVVAAAVAAAVGLALGASGASGAGGDGRPTELLVTLRSPAAAYAADRPAAVRRIAREQRAFVSSLRRAVPGAQVRWRYRTVANGLAVVAPRASLATIRALPGVRAVDLPARYVAQRGAPASAAAGPREVNATAIWGSARENQGQGIKIAFVDDGVDQTHPYFDPTGYTMPPGYPKGQKAFTTAKVIVARAFPPAGATWKNAGKAFDPENSDHATHVAGIAAGNAGTKASGQVISGVAPQAYIGNYKALTVPTDSGVGLDGNAPEIVAAIEAAVNDGMDVINLSIGEPEIEPARDTVAKALDAAAAAGVIPVVAAGNDFGGYGRGSVTSPGSAPSAITVAATSNETAATTPEIAGFSSAGPTALSLRLKPDVSAPGSGILSSVPNGQWRTLSGTSMAAPHVAGAAALLQQLHPEWTPEQVKAAMVSTARPANMPEGGEAPPTRAGSGSIDLAAAATPLVTSSPTSVSFGLVAAGDAPERSVQLLDAGGGAGLWNVVVQPVESAGSAVPVAPAQVTVPGPLALSLSTAGANADEVSGVVRLEKDGVVRRIAYWGRIVQPALAQVTPKALPRPGIYKGDTRTGTALVERYLYPEVPTGSNATSVLRGPEQVFRITLPRRAANLGVVVVSRTTGTTVEPRIVAAGNEARLQGYAALPININPYLAGFETPVLASGVLSPKPGRYDVVFDSRTADGAGAFTFRYWVDDVVPPTAKIVAKRVKRDQPVLIAVADAGAGVDPSSVVVALNGTPRAAKLQKDVLRIPTLGLAPGRYALRVQVSDYQETRNNENVGRILPNTRVLRVTIEITA